MSVFADALGEFDGEIARLNAHMRGRMQTEVSLAADIIVRQLAGGKRLRAIVAMLSARLCGLREESSLETAAAIEFIHTATLLHDDVVDDADTRRRQATANRVYGNAASVLVGDFLYSRASQILAQLGSVRLLQRMTDATNRLSEGELLQLLARGSGNVSERMYFSIIERKTANLFEIAAAGPAILAEKSAEEKALAEYGRRLGLAFQLVDDCLDYEGGDTGKEIGRDFSEGKMTLPVILTVAQTSAKERDALINGWRSGAPDVFAKTLRMVQKSGALAQTRARAAEEAAAAAAQLQKLQETKPRTETETAALHSLAKLAKTSPDRTA